MSSSTVIEEIIVACSEWAVAYFYFDFRNDRQQRMDIVLRSIVWQLSECSSSPYSTLHELYKGWGMERYSHKAHIFKKFLKIYFQSLTRHILSLMGLMNVTRPNGSLLPNSFTAYAIPSKMHYISCLLVNLLRNFKQHSRM
jgi:hypothetical protein